MFTEDTPFPDVLDSTILATFKACRHKAWLEYLLHWKPREPSVHLHAGASFAKGLEVARTSFFVDNQPTDEAAASGLHALLTAYGDFECPQDSAKSAERTAGAYEFYLQNYPLGQDGCIPVTLPGGKRGIEFSFAHPLPIKHPQTGDPIIYAGRMDMLANFADGVFVEDDKTASSLGALWGRQWDLRSQFTGYAWGCREAGIKADGVLVRGVSILKTKYDTQQAVSYRPVWQIDRWFEETCQLVGEMITCWESGKWLHNLDHACTDFGGCMFRNVCLSQDTQPWLENYFQRRKWNPIAREETIL